MAKTEPAVEQAPEPTFVDVTDRVTELAVTRGLTAEPDLAQTEADNYARAHQPSPIKEE